MNLKNNRGKLLRFMYNFMNLVYGYFWILSNSFETIETANFMSNPNNNTIPIVTDFNKLQNILLFL